MALDQGADMPVVELDGNLGIAQANALAEGRARLVLTARVLDRCAASHDRLAQAIAERRHIYGITTGFGPLANRLLDPADGVLLQQNLIHHLASGIGPVFEWATARAIVLARLSAILQGVSGASGWTIASLIRVINSPLAPAIPERGTVGASGDLTPLAHMVLCLQGRAPFLDASGNLIEGMEGLRQLGLEPLDLGCRDGLALVNGTSAMTGVALRNALVGARLCDWALGLTAALAEVMAGRSEAWHPMFAKLRPHPGQIEAARILRSRVSGSTRMTETPIAARQLSEDDIAGDMGIAQDAYTLRCAPQVIGGVLDSLDWHDRVLAIELNAVTDNPIFPDDGSVAALHGGNFMGQHVGLVSDALANAITVLAGLAERQVARVTDEKLNGDLPAFLHMGRAGLNSGLMGAQVTASALLGELRTTGAASKQSISTNGANQDVVSMGTIAARHAHAACDRASEILAILTLAVVQAIDIRKDRGVAGFSESAEHLRACVRARFGAIETDRPLGPEIAEIADIIRSMAFPESSSDS